MKENSFAAVVAWQRVRPMLMHLLILSGLTLLLSCWGKVVAVGIVTACPRDGKVELRVLLRDRGRGNIHYPSVRFHDYPSYDILLVSERLGVIRSDAIELRRYDGAYPVRVLDGSVTLAVDTVDIDIRVPSYSRGTPGSYTEVDYPFNGRFSLQTKCGE